MINILKKQNGMNIIGQGGKIILFTLPSFIAAILVDLRFTPDRSTARKPEFFPTTRIPIAYSWADPLGDCSGSVVNRFF